LRWQRRLPRAIRPLTSEEASLRQLLTIRRVYVDRLTGGETAAQMREILFSSLQATTLFVVTEKEERADAVLRGGAEDLVSPRSTVGRMGSTRTSISARAARAVHRGVPMAA
jgi:hypothetical protein